MWGAGKEMFRNGYNAERHLPDGFSLSTIKERIIKRTWVDKGSDGIWMALKG